MNGGCNRLLLGLFWLLYNRFDTYQTPLYVAVRRTLESAEAVSVIFHGRWCWGALSFCTVLGLDKAATDRQSAPIGGLLKLHSEPIGKDSSSNSDISACTVLFKIRYAEELRNLPPPTII
ncbi:hypothetical protein chiPu_0001593 [Chiloscyllium punctatum]|uniref:Uncharacterized protein n=1 Tax=Chiloscyllium punctatum TaxID=137246 RepID=A0A401RYK8_CHIPU|nr:hypothetical protein [Chiloscyllium punctatum]